MFRILMLASVLTAGLTAQATAGTVNVTFPNLTYPKEAPAPDITTKTITEDAKK